MPSPFKFCLTFLTLSTLPSMVWPLPTRISCPVFLCGCKTCGNIGAYYTEAQCDIFILRRTQNYSERYLESNTQSKRIWPLLRGIPQSNTAWWTSHFTTDSLCLILSWLNKILRFSLEPIYRLLLSYEILKSVCKNRQRKISSDERYSVSPRSRYLQRRSKKA